MKIDSLTEKQLDGIYASFLKLKEKYNSITNLLEQIDSEMTEYYVALEDIDYFLSQKRG